MKQLCFYFAQLLLGRNNKKTPFIAKKREKLLVTPLLISQAMLAGFGTVQLVRCRGVIGPVPQPLLIRKYFKYSIY